MVDESGKVVYDEAVKMGFKQLAVQAAAADTAAPPASAAQPDAADSKPAQGSHSRLRRMELRDFASGSLCAAVWLHGWGRGCCARAGTRGGRGHRNMATKWRWHRGDRQGPRKNVLLECEIGRDRGRGSGRGDAVRGRES